MQDDYLFALQQLRESLPDFVSVALGSLSNFVGGVGAIALVLVVYWCISKRDGLWLILAFFYGAFIGQMVKNFACVYRPWIYDVRLHVADIAAAGATGYSLPSVHSAAAVAVFGGIALLLWKRHRAWSALSGLVCLLAVFSRNFLGCHTLADVLAGVAVGALALVLAWATRRLTEGNPGARPILCAAGGLATIALLAYTTFKWYPLDYDAAGNLLVDPWDMQTDCYRCAGALLALFIAWPLEEGLIGFNTNASTRALVIRAVAGVALAVALYVGVLPLLIRVLDAHWYYFSAYFVLVAMMMLVYPALFSRLGHRWQ